MKGEPAVAPRWVVTLIAVAIGVVGATPGCSEPSPVTGGGGKDGAGAGRVTSSNGAGAGGHVGATNAGGSQVGGSNPGGSTPTSGGGGSGGTADSSSPTATITAPADGDAFAIGASIHFQGSATDPEDGPITGNSLAWVGDIGADAIPEGFGSSGDTSFATAGDHTLTLTATDSDGHTGSQTITVHVQ